MQPTRSRCLAVLSLSLLPLGRPFAPQHVPRTPRPAARLPAIRLQQLGGGGGLDGFFKQVFGTRAGADGEEDADFDYRAASATKFGDDFRGGAAEDLEYVPLVLVIGAAGRTGRIITRKLVLQGFRVAVLVRSLSTETLNLLGSGVSYSYGDMTDYRTLLDAMEDVDRIIFAADGVDDDTELNGLQQVLRAFQDTRTFMYGDAEATKLTLLKMKRDNDFNRWKVEDAQEEIAGRLASAGIGPKPSIAYWKRSPTGAHNNGVFVGKVFDTYLGSASVACSLSGLLVGGFPPALSAAAREQKESLLAAGELDGAAPEAAPAAEAEAEEASPELNRAAAAMAAGAVPLDLGEYSGLVMRLIGDGKQYTAIIRTRQYAVDGVEYQADFKASASHFESVRLPFSKFVPVRGGRPARDAPEMDKHAIVGMALAFYPQRNNPEAAGETAGEFYLSVCNIKTYRKRDEPEFVYLSDAGVAALPELADPRTSQPAAAASVAAAAAIAAADDAKAAAHEGEPSAAVVSRRKRFLTKQKGEALLRASGLTYFITRATQLDDRPPGARKLIFSQGSDLIDGSISRADVAEVAVRSLLDPRACNVACTVSESQAVEGGQRQLSENAISKALEVLEPNRM